MEIPELPLFTSGPLTSGKLNRVRDVVAIWQNPPAALSRASASQSITSGGAYQLVTFHTTEYDTDSVVTSTSRFTVQTAGRYLVAATATFSANTSGSRYVTVRKNAAGSPTGGTVLASGTASPVSGASTTVSLPANLRVALSAGDTLEAFVFQDSGSTLTLNSSPGDTFMIVELVAVSATLSGTEGANLPSLHAETYLGTANLNDVLAPGNYVQTNSPDATLARNYPEVQGGHLQVFSDGSTSPDLTTQVYRTYQTLSPKVWMRNRYITTWGSWSESGGSGSGNSGVLTWDGATYQPTSLHTATTPREFRGPTDPSTVSGITVNHYDVWTEIAAPSATVPGQVTGLSATAGNGQVSLSWVAPSNGGSAITDYVVERRVSGGSWSTFPDGTSTTTAATVTGLTNGTAYGFRVSAVNAVGTGVASLETLATPEATASYRTVMTGLAPVVYLEDAITGNTPPTDIAGNVTTFYPRTENDTDVSFYPTGGQTSLGDAGTATLYNGTTEGVSLGRPAVLDGLTSLSFVALVKVINLTNQSALVNRDDGGATTANVRDYQFNVMPTTGTLKFVHIGGNYSFVTEISSTTPVTLGTTHLVGFTANGTALTIYLDGVAVGSGTLLSGRHDAPIDTKIGVQFNPAAPADRYYMDGHMDGVALFDRALTSTEWANLATAAGV